MRRGDKRRGFKRRSYTIREGPMRVVAPAPRLVCELLEFVAMLRRVVEKSQLSIGPSVKRQRADEVYGVVVDTVGHQPPPCNVRHLRHQ